MFRLQALIPIAIILVSFLIGIVFYYVISQQSKVEKKAQIDKVTSYLINFVLFIWVGKIIGHISLFVTDPIAVLARPSDAFALYIAMILITVNVIYDTMKRKVRPGELLYVFIPIFISASFVYEFIKIALLNNTNTWGYLTLLFILLIGVVSLYGKMEDDLFIILMIFLWILGQFVLSYTSLYIVIYSYLISRLFLVVIFIGLLIRIGLYFKGSHRSNTEAEVEN